jgi:glycosyltransferase involved in cell wall biosynthesis
MGSGCALLLRDVPGNRDLVIPGENGWLFKTSEEAAERLTVMINDKNLLNAMGKKSREIVEKSFSLKQMGDGYRRLYVQEAAGGKGAC